MRILGVIGNDLSSLERTGQLSRVTDFYWPYYAKAFDQIYVFSPLPRALVAESNPKVTIIPPKITLSSRSSQWLSPWLYPELRKCSVLRIMHMSAAIPAILCKLLFGIPFLATYGFDYARFVWFGRRPKIVLGLKWAYTSLVVKLGIRLADLIVITSPEASDDLKRLGRISKIAHIPNGVDTAFFKPNIKQFRSEPTVRYLFVGRLEKQKNLFMLIDSLAAVQKELPLLLTLVGEGSLREEILCRAQKVGLPIRLLGVISHKNLVTVMNEHDVFVLPSLEEGHPKSLLEAMSCGMACVGTNVRGIAPLIRHAKTGLLADLSVESLARQLAWVGSNVQLRAQLGRTGRAFISEHFDIDMLLQKETGCILSLVPIDKVGHG